MLSPVTTIAIDFFVVQISVELLIPYLSRLLRGSLPSDIRHRVRKVILSFSKIDRPRRLHAQHVKGGCTVRVRVHVSKGVSLRGTRRATANVRRELGRGFKRSARINVRIRPIGWRAGGRWQEVYAGRRLLLGRDVNGQDGQVC